MTWRDDAEGLVETTLNPRTRRLLRVEVTDQILTDRVMNELMGKDASARFRFIMKRFSGLSIRVFDAVVVDVIHVQARSH